MSRLEHRAHVVGILLIVATIIGLLFSSVAGASTPPETWDMSDYCDRSAIIYRPVQDPNIDPFGLPDPGGNEPPARIVTFLILTKRSYVHLQKKRMRADGYKVSSREGIWCDRFWAADEANATLWWHIMGFRAHKTRLAETKCKLSGVVGNQTLERWPIPPKISCSLPWRIKDF